MSLSAESRLRRPVPRESRQRLNAGESRLRRWCNTPANETVFSIFGRHNMVAPVRSFSDKRDNPKTLNRSGVYIYNYNNVLL